MKNPFDFVGCLSVFYMGNRDIGLDLGIWGSLVVFSLLITMGS